MNQPDLQGRRGHREVRGTVGHDTPVVAPGRSMDHHIGPHPFDHFADCGSIPDVELLAGALGRCAEGRPDDRPSGRRRTVRGP